MYIERLNQGTYLIIWAALWGGVSWYIYTHYFRVCECEYIALWERVQKLGLLKRGVE